MAELNIAIQKEILRAFGFLRLRKGIVNFNAKDVNHSTLRTLHYTNPMEQGNKTEDTGAAIWGKLVSWHRHNRKTGTEENSRHWAQGE